MANIKNDLLYKRLANLYVQEYGKELQQELAFMEAQNHRYLTPRMDSRIKELVKTKPRTYRRAAAAIAAAILLLVIIPVLVSRFELSAPPLSEPAVSAPAAAGESAAPASPQGNESSPPSDGHTAGTAGLLPLDFILPPNLSVESWKLDNGKSVYHLQDTLQDDVVLVMEETALGNNDEGMKKIDLDGADAYVLDEPDYKMLVLEKDGILYTMTCEYDINTLLALGREIL